MEPSDQFCSNPMCSARGQTGQGNIRVHVSPRQRYRCKYCKQTFSAKRGTMFEGRRKPTELIVIVVTLLAFGCPVQAIVHAFDLDERTVASWRDRAGSQCQRVHQAIVEQGRLDLVPMGCATSVLLGAPRLLDHARSPHANKQWWIMAFRLGRFDSAWGCR
jgi:transposase-like protein